MGLTTGHPRSGGGSRKGTEPWRAGGEGGPRAAQVSEAQELRVDLPPQPPPPTPRGRHEPLFLGVPVVRPSPHSTSPSPARVAVLCSPMTPRAGSIYTMMSVFVLSAETCGKL